MDLNSCYAIDQDLASDLAIGKFLYKICQDFSGHRNRMELFASAWPLFSQILDSVQCIDFFKSLKYLSL